MTDAELARAIRALPVPDHAPGFWERLEAELAEDAYARHPAVAARRRWPLLAAAVVVAVAAIGALVTRDGDVPVTTPSPTPTTTVRTPGQEVPGSIAVARTFLEAAGRRDVAVVADLLGPGSRAYLSASGRSVASLLADEVWPDPRTSGLENLRVDAEHEVVLASAGAEVLPLPVRLVAGRWLAEPWAYSPQVGPVGITLVSGSESAAGAELRLATPVDGLVHLGLDHQLGAHVRTTDRLATWVPMVVGRHRVIATLFEGDVFLADAPVVTIAAQPATAEGAANIFRSWWLVGDREHMATYGSLAAVDQALGIPIAGWALATADGCEGAAGSVYCTWARDDGARMVIRVANVEGPPVVKEVRVER